VTLPSGPRPVKKHKLTKKRKKTVELIVNWFDWKIDNTVWSAETRELLREIRDDMRHCVWREHILDPERPNTTVTKS
jgi:hypothetical protein